MYHTWGFQELIIITPITRELNCWSSQSLLFAVFARLARLNNHHELESNKIWQNNLFAPGQLQSFPRIVCSVTPCSNQIYFILYRPAFKVTFWNSFLAVVSKLNTNCNTFKLALDIDMLWLDDYTVIRKDHFHVLPLMESLIHEYCFLLTIHNGNMVVSCIHLLLFHNTH